MENQREKENGSFKSRIAYLKPYIASLLEPAKIIWQDPLGRAGSIIFLVICFIALFAPWLATHNPNEMNQRIEGSVISFNEDKEWKDYEIIGDDPINDMSSDENTVVAVTEENQVIIAQDDRWEEEEIDPEIELLAVTISDDQIIAAGRSGQIAIRDNDSWEYETIPTEVDINALASSQDNSEVLAVGDEGSVFLYSDADWEELESEENQDLNAVDFSPAGDAIIVGNQGTIMHYEAKEITDPEYEAFGEETFRDLYDVDYSLAEKAFAVGERGTIMGFSGEAWYSTSGDTSRELRGVTVLAENNALAAGYHGVIQHFDGEEWYSLDRITTRGYRGIDFFENQGFVYGVDPYINELAPPSTEHFFGTNHLGRDIWSQVVYGSRTALLVGILAALMVNGIGFTVGLVSGYYGGKVDNLLMRIVDIMYGMPLEPFAIVLVLIFGPSLWIIILAIGLLTWRTNARVIRSQVLSLAKRPFVKAARVAGASNLRIMLVHISPNVLPLAFLQLAVAMGYAITAEATLSFLGLGPPRVYSWGTILHAARLSGAWRVAWWWVIPPGIFISATVVSVFLISRSVEVMTNPRLRGGNDSAPEPEESEDVLPHGQ